MEGYGESWGRDAGKHACSSRRFLTSASCSISYSDQEPLIRDDESRIRPARAAPSPTQTELRRLHTIRRVEFAISRRKICCGAILGLGLCCCVKSSAQHCARGGGGGYECSEYTDSLGMRVLGPALCFCADTPRDVVDGGGECGFSRALETKTWVRVPLPGARYGEIRGDTGRYGEMFRF